MADNAQVRRENESLLRESLRGGAYSKNELAHRTGLSFPTVGRIVDDMVSRGEAAASGEAASTGGRCAMRYALVPDFRLYLCLRLENRTLDWSVCDINGGAVERGEISCGNDILCDLDTLLMRVRARYPQLVAAAMGFAGSMMDGSVTVAFEPHELRGVNLKKHLSDILGLPAAAKRDMELVAKGYAVRRMARTVVCIYIGHAGMGAGIVLDGRVWSGAHGFAGEIHFLPIENNLKYAENHFEGADMTAYCTSVVRSLAALLDPECIVFYRAPRFDGITERVRTACAALLPASAMPEITLSNEWIEDYEAGLFATACEEENA